MLTVQLNDLPLRTTWTKGESRQRAHSTFPFLLAQENKGISLVYFELNPGDHLGTHTDSAEEVLFIFEGTVEVTVGEEEVTVEAPALALVPTLVRHNLKNVGDTRAKVAGFFPAKQIIATFDHAWLPDDTHIIDTAQLGELMVQQS
ncbi:MAG: cupin domain-containing protein [Anaerolineae bacterium]|nr:cupin domain-containing protein [Anaerolineae bacterium]